MSTYFALPLAAPVQQHLDELLANLDSGSTAPQHELHTRVSLETTDEILRLCVEDLIARFQANPENVGVLHTLLGLLKSTAHMLLRQLLGKGSNAEVARMAQYLRRRRLVLKGETRFGFVLPEELAGRFRTAFAAIAAGEGEAQRAVLHQTMTAFAELALQHFYDDFVAPMELGFIKRKAADLGRATIGKGVQVAVDKLFPQMRQQELRLFADYFAAFLVTA